ncbi:MAG TPA: NAD(P)H-binding protein, partial [Ktedonobacterales bacterium]|nr:NAD(P)H-binding protein [Ktedonobacterales bacterium]
MRVCIIGGTGFIGYNVTLESQKRGHTVTILGRHPPQPDHLFAPDVTIIQGDYLQMSDDALRDLLANQQAVIFAVRFDETGLHKIPAYDSFYRPHVLGCERIFRIAREQGAQRGVIIGSYFTYFNRIWPDLRLTQHHPYMRARQEQADVSLAAAAPSMDLMILEMPYIMGIVPGRVPQWASLIRYVNSSLPLWFTAGGTNMIAVSHVSEAIVGAIEKGKGGEWYTIGERNVTWATFLSDISRQLGRNKRVITIPTPIVRTIGWGLHGSYVVRRKERGLDPASYMRLQT